jgi:hypothetical protein
VLHAYSAPEVYLQGETVRHANVARDAGPRAVMKAMERIIESYPDKEVKTRQELAVAQGQLRDYEERIGRPFGHDAYMRELAELRDELRAGLSGTSEEGKEPVDTEAVAERIKALRAANAVEGMPERVKSVRKATAEVPVTARIRKREEEKGEVPEVEAKVEEARPPALQSEPIVVPEAVMAEPSFRERVTRGPERQGRWF